MKRASRLIAYFFIMVLPAAALFLVPSVQGEEDAAGAMNARILVIVHPSRVATLSAEVLSVVKNIHNEMGDKFRKGDVLIELDPALYLADKKKADALLTYSEAVYKTNLKLYKQKSVSEIEFSRAKADFKVAEGNVAIAQKKLSACLIRSPYTGRVVKQLINENELVQPGQPLIEIVDDRTMRAQFLVPSPFWSQIQPGQVLDLSMEGIDKEFECKITHVSPVLESNTSTFQVFAEIDNAGHLLRGGMTGEIVLTSTIAGNF